MITAERARELTDKYYSVKDRVQEILDRVEIAAKRGHDSLYMQIDLARGTPNGHMLEPIERALKGLGYDVSHRRDGKVIDVKW